MNAFEIVTEKPELDTKTLNYVWDRLWRFNASKQAKNAEERIRRSERERIMEMLAEMQHD